VKSLSFFFLSACAYAQLTAVPNTDFPTFRSNLNNSLANGVNRTINYSNPSFINTLDWSKIINAPALGTGTLTNVQLTGTGSQITLSGTCSSTAIVTCVLSLPSVLILPGTVNRITLTAPATGATITVLDTKTLTVSNTVTLSGTDGSTITYGAGGTVSYIGVAETLSGNKTFTGFLNATGASHTLPVKVGTGVPAITCTVGEIFFSSTVSAGSNLYFCTSTDVWTQMTGGSGGGQSVFGGSIATATTGITGTAAAPILSLTDQSLKSPKCFEINLTASTPVTSVTINNKTSGAEFCVAWTQPASNMTTVTYGGSVTGTCDPTVDPGASVTTTQYFRIKSDGSTVLGVGCKSDNSGVDQGPEISAPINPTSGHFTNWNDSTTHVFSHKANGASTVSSTVVEKSSRTANQFLTHITGGVQQPAAIVDADIPAAITRTIASGTKALTTGALAGNTCTAANTSSATGVLITDTITFTPNVDISGFVGYGAASTDGLAIYPYPTADNVNFKICNVTGTSITLPAVTLNYRVIR